MRRDECEVNITEINVALMKPGEQLHENKGSRSFLCNLNWRDVNYVILKDGSDMLH